MGPRGHLHLLQYDYKTILQKEKLCHETVQNLML